MAYGEDATVDRNAVEPPNADPLLVTPAIEVPDDVIISITIPASASCATSLSLLSFPFLLMLLCSDPKRDGVDALSLFLPYDFLMWRRGESVQRSDS